MSYAMLPILSCAMYAMCYVLRAACSFAILDPQSSRRDEGTRVWEIGTSPIEYRTMAHMIVWHVA